MAQHTRQPRKGFGIGSIQFADIGGDIAGSVNLIARTGGGQSTLTFVHVSGGVFGDVLVDHGSIIDFLVDGPIGTGTSPVVVRALDNIKHITASEIYADISTTANLRAVQAVRTTTGGFVGSLQSTYLAAITGTGATGDTGIAIAGTLDADVTFTSTATFGISCTSLPVGRTISIGDSVVPPTGSPLTITTGAGSLDGTLAIAGGTNGSTTSPITISSSGVSGAISIGGTASGFTTISPGAISATGRIAIGSSLAGAINMPANGLAGQVVVNSNNGTGTWTGAVTVGSTTLSPHNDYSTPSSALGGGAVGVVAYGLHQSDCQPGPGPTNSSPALIGTDVNLNNFPSSTVTLSWYGPVQPGSGSPVSIELYARTSTPTTYAWTHVESAFVTTVNPDGAARSVSIAPASGIHLALGLYRVTRASGGLLCAETTASPAPDVAEFAYYFRVYPDCNNSGGADPDELAATDAPDCNGDGILDCTQLDGSNDHNGDHRFDNCHPCDPVSDWDGNGHWEPADVAAFVNTWYADLANGTFLADFDHNGAVEPADVSLFVLTWFTQLSAGC